MKLNLRIIAILLLLLVSIVIYLFYLLISEEIDYYYEPAVPYKSPVLEHKLCVIVPYRNRLEELTEFGPHMTRFLQAQNVSHHLLILNQTDELRFNRASLINVGWNEADRLGCDYMVMNDVDLLPVNKEIPYQFPGHGVIRHITSPEYHPKYHYKKFIGGILMLTMADYKMLNGMSNKYWGWGLEDDELYLRITESSLSLTRVSGLTTNSTNTFRHIHGPKRKRDYAKKDDKKQWELKRKRDRVSGLRDVKYRIADRRTLIFDDAKVNVVDVELHCNLKWTPYCKT